MSEPKRPLKVFLSYASQDKPAVRELSGRLVSEGWIDPWVDEKKLLPGQDWRTKIEEAVETSDIVIICLSSNSVTKEGFVQKELRYAREVAFEKPDETIFLVPLRLDECTVPRGLRFYQWGDYFGDNKEETYNALLESLKLRHEQKLKLEAEEHVRREKTEEERIALEEKVRKEAEEKTRWEAAERVRRVREEREREAAEEKAQKEAKEKARHEKAERRVAQIAARKETLSRSVNAIKSTLPRAVPFLRISSVVGVAIALFWVSSWGFSKIASLVPTVKASTTPTLRSSTTFTFTVSPQLPTQTATPKPTSTKTLIPIPTAILPTEITDVKGVTMRIVPAGEFAMGSDNSDDEKPVHQVYLGGFYMDTYEVTNTAYRACVNANICGLPKPADRYNNPKYKNHPVVYVDWYMANAYCEWRGGSLPTEAQWEKASRGIDGRSYPWGDGNDCEKTNYNNCKGDTIAVGSYESGKSPYGIYDLAGNVWEWVADWYSETYYENSPSENPLGPNSGQYRVLRGGSWYDYGFSVRSATRGYDSPVFITNYIGFRCAKDAP